jgi:hypothetical protein
MLTRLNVLEAICIENARCFGHFPDANLLFLHEPTRASTACTIHLRTVETGFTPAYSLEKRAMSGRWNHLPQVTENPRIVAGACTLFE